MRPQGLQPPSPSFGDGHFAAETDDGVDRVVHVGERFDVVEGHSGYRVAFAGLACTPGEDLVGPDVEANLVAEDDGDEGARAEPAGVVGCDDQREVNRPCRRTTSCFRSGESARCLPLATGWLECGHELGCARIVGVVGGSSEAWL